MTKLITLALSMGFALCYTGATAESDTTSVIRMVILGTNSGDGMFTTDAISISAGIGKKVMGGYLVDSEIGAIGSAVFTGAGNEITEGALTGFETTATPYETIVCMPGARSCPMSEAGD
jgi:hypothetical protein